jgi:hypothetical protein
MPTEKRPNKKVFLLAGAGIPTSIFLASLAVKCKGGNCYACKGFEGVTRRENKKDGWVVKVLDKRKTVGGTCWYQLNHCSVRRGSKKSHATTWFGTCAYRKLDLSKEEDAGIHHKCPICSSEMVHVRYLGQSKLLLTRRGEILSMFAEDGSPLWEVVEEEDCKHKHGGFG